jgi:ABC-type transport system involved in multi-copper enzyme maturation permease subunit
MIANLPDRNGVEEPVDRSRRPSELRSTLLVALWELRRLLASRLNFIVGLGAFSFFVALLGIKHEWLVPVETGGGHGAVLTVFGSTAVGVLFEIVGILLLFFGMLLPFLAAGAVSHDYQDRTHEILMATPMPNVPYVIGRFLAAIAAGVGTAALLLLAIIVANLFLHAFDASFPPQDVVALGLAWLLLVIPAVVLLSGVSFFLGTLLPRLATPIKVMLVLTWGVLSVVVDIGHGLGWFGYWTPTGNGVLKVIPPQVAADYAARLAGGAAPASAATVQQAMPNLVPWVGPHLGLVAIGLLAGLVAAVAFRRFKEVLG